MIISVIEVGAMVKVKAMVKAKVWVMAMAMASVKFCFKSKSPH